MDYSICQALKRFPWHLLVLIIYDICCQWIIHFRERVSESEFLELSDSIGITGAIGKFHLAAHIPECFPLFTLNFIEGAGQVDGEILETLWSNMDEVAGLAQAMSLAHHQEVVDDHMNDSNWRKMIRTGTSNIFSMPHDLTDGLLLLTWWLADSLCGKWERAKEGVSTTESAFEQLTDCLDPSLIDEWTSQERVAMEMRGENLNIFTVTSVKCRRFCYAALGLLICLSTHTGGNTNEAGRSRGAAG
jgi:hypothetical protein